MINWEEAIENFITFLTLERSFSINSIKAYKTDIQKLNNFCKQHEPPLQLQEITLDVLTKFIHEYSKSKIAKRSQARCISSIKTFFKYLVYDEILTINPASLLTIPKLDQKLPQVLSVEEIDSMIAAIDLSHPEGQRNKAIIETLYSCGVRVSELVTIQLSNIHFQEGYIKIRGKGNKERFVPISSKARHEIQLYLNEKRQTIVPEKGYEDTLFLNKQGKGLSRVMVFYIVKQLALKAGIHKTISPHTLRHSFASHLINGGANIRMVQDMLGHESILTTEIYTHLDHSYLRDMLINYHPRSKQAIKKNNQME